LYGPIAFLILGYGANMGLGIAITNYGALCQILDRELNKLVIPFWRFFRIYDLLPCFLNTILIIDAYRRLWKAGTIKKWKMVLHIISMSCIFIAALTFSWWITSLEDILVNDRPALLA
jgi:hypothetical protein